MLSLGRIPGLRGIEVVDGELRLGAMATHRAVERDGRVCAGWPVLARAFGLVASPRVRNQATVGGVLADADYASDPPAVLQALGARARAALAARRARGGRSASSSSGTTRRASRRTSCWSRSGSRQRPSGPSTASSGRARARTGRASPSRRRGRAAGCGSWSGPSRRRRRSSPTCARSPTGGRSIATSPPRSPRLRRAHRADRRRARLRGLPPPGHGGRGAPRDRGAGVMSPARAR